MNDRADRSHTAGLETANCIERKTAWRDRLGVQIRDAIASAFPGRDQLLSCQRARPVCIGLDGQQDLPENPS